MTTLVNAIIIAVGGIGASIAIYSAIYVLLLAPVRSFAATYARARRAESAAVLQALLDSEPGASAIPLSCERRLLREMQRRGLGAIRTQQLISSGLIIGLVGGWLVWRLAITTLNAVGAAGWLAVQIGAPTALFFSILFYGSLNIERMERTLAARTTFTRGLALALTLCLSTLATLAIVPPLIGAEWPLDAALAIGLAINIVGSMVINLWASLGGRFWLRAR